ncbi:glycosyl hydrolase, partial [uncultured Winogradskyella sp.]|uniref:glycosyl hydrolase n=1 Tax=uncultured Winogradskyella sp. TaxID=395353 RepID=UPI00261B17B2
YMKDWTDYLARNHYVLQQGEYVADVLRYYGDHFERPPFDLDEFPKGYRVDYLNAEILHDKLSVENGKIHVENAGDYRIITLRDSKEMLLSTVKKLKKLVLGGAVILGDKPLDSPSLMDDENDLKELALIADELWGNTKEGVKRVGKGKVYWGKSLDAVLEAERIAQDVIVPDDLDIKWIHRETTDAHIYFVASNHDKPVDATLSFRIKDMYPQLWNAFNGEQQEAKVWSTSDDRTNVTLSFAPSGSTIVVFSKGDKLPYASKVTYDNAVILNAETGWYNLHDTKDFPSITWKDDNCIASNAGVYTFYQNGNKTSKTIAVNEQSLKTNWQLNFDDGWDTPKSIQISELKSLPKLENDAVKHYSGTTTYAKTFNLQSLGKQTIIDLGAVSNIAELWCNDKKVGVKWAPPFTFDISEFVTNGENRLEIKVTNTWRNQLIFDNQRPKDKKKTWTTNPPRKNETELEDSGLIGPVVIKILN